MIRTQPQPPFSAHVHAPSKKDGLKFGLYLPPVQAGWQRQSRQALSMLSGFSHTQASIASCRQKNNVCARAGFLSKTPRGFIPSSASGGPAPGKQPLGFALGFEFLLWLRCSGCLCRRTLVVGVEAVEAEKVLNPEKIRDPVALRMSAKRPSWP